MRRPGSRSVRRQWARRRVAAVGGGGGENSPPTVAIDSPTAGAVLVSGTAYNITGTASDDSAVDNVKVYLGDPDSGGTLLGTATGTTSWTYSYTPVDGQAGSTALYAVAEDDAAATTKSAGVSVTVKTAVQNAIDSINALSPAAFYYNSFTIDSGNAESGDQISQWTDLSGNTRHATQSTQDDQPTVTSVGPEYSVTFDDGDGTSGDTLAMPTAPYSGASALTVFTAFRRNGRAAAHEGPFSANSSNWRWAFTATASDALRLYVGASNYGATSALTFNATDQFCCVRFDGAGADNAARLKLYTANTERTLTYTGTIPATVPAITTMQMARNGASTLPGALSVYLYIVFASALSDTDRDTVDTHCKTLLSWY